MTSVREAAHDPLPEPGTEDGPADGPGPFEVRVAPGKALA